MKYIKLFENFDNSYSAEAKKAFDEIESIMGVKISPEIYNKIIDSCLITNTSQIEEIMNDFKPLDAIQEIIMHNIVTAFYPDLKDSIKLKNTYWAYVKKWHEKYKKTNLVNFSEEEQKIFKDKLLKVQDIIKNLKSIVINSPECEVIIGCKDDVDKYNL
jgi:hypothetical protein